MSVDDFIDHSIQNPCVECGSECETGSNVCLACYERSFQPVNPYIGQAVTGEYEVNLVCEFSASCPEEAVWMFVQWLKDPEQLEKAVYLVSRDDDPGSPKKIEGEDIPWW